MVLVNNIMLMSWQFKKQGHTVNVNKFEENALTYLNEQSKWNLVLKNKKTYQGQMMFKEVERFFKMMNLIFKHSFAILWLIR